MKTLLLLSIVFFANNAFSCRTDFDCGFGNKCIKPSGSFSFTGNCITPTDEFGNRDYSATSNNWGNSLEPKEVKSCEFNSDCGFKAKCLKESGQLYGLCIK